MKRQIGNSSSLKKAFPNCKIIFNKGYHYVSGFVGFPNGKWVYFSSFDDRDSNWRYYVRTARDEKDYTGGMNVHVNSQKREVLFEKIRELSNVPHKQYP